MSDTNSFSDIQGQENQCGNFAETTAFESNMHIEHWPTSTRFSPFSDLSS